MVGLGNPGERYRRTRHNAGFMAVDVLAARVGARGRVEGDAWVAEATLGGAPAALVKTLAFMNASGGPVARVLAERSGSPADLVVLVDDVALELDTIRVRERGSHGGHNGLRSLVETLGTEEFARVRIGVRRRLGLRERIQDGPLIQRRRVRGPREAPRGAQGRLRHLT